VDRLAGFRFFRISFFIHRAFFVSLPYDLEETTMIDGTGCFYIPRRIIAPLAIPGLEAVVVLEAVTTTRAETTATAR
jgi:ABC-type glycerol-3-phosphate transport system permease component